MTPPADKPRRLGRGLEALLASAGAPAAAQEQSALRQLPLRDIRPNPYQPRQDFPTDELADLQASLKASGLLQPITVRPAAGANGFELVAGERRLRAATNLGWTEIPAIVRELDDRTLLTLALVENLQRSDLNPIEEAEGYQRLISDFALTQQQVAQAVGKDRSTVANLLRLLGLPSSLRRLLADGKLTLGHARALLAVADERAMVELGRQAVAQGLSVREVERRAREAGARKRPRSPGAPTHDSRPAEARQLENELRRYLQTDVTLALTAAAAGTLTVHFYSAEDLERIMDLIVAGRRPPYSG